MAIPANPVLRGMYPDPSVCRVDGTYYLVNSTFEYLPAIPIHSSTDLQTWQLVGHAITDQSGFDYSTIADSGGIFAPTIRHHDGLFYIACTQMGAGAGTGSFYLTASDVAGPWSEPVFLPDARGIDPSLFFHDGRAWWIGCREVLDPMFEGETEVWMRELDLERGELVGPETVIWTRTQYRAVWAEAPHLYHRDGWICLVTAEGGTAFEHSVMVARSRDVAGPYLPCPRNPVLTHRHLGSRVDVQNVGHADLFEGDDGEWWMAVLACRPIAGHHILGRETHLAAVTWEDDWPVVNPGLGRLDAPVPRAGSWGSVGVPSPADFLTVRGNDAFAQITGAGVVLRSTGDAPGSMQPVAALLRRLSSTDGTVSITLRDIGADAVAGLILRQSDGVHARLELSRRDEEIRVDLVVRQGTDDTIASVPLSARELVLAAHLSRDGVIWTAGAPSSVPVELGRTPLSGLSTETAGGFVGVTFGPYVAGPKGASVAFAAWTQDDLS